MNLVKWIRKNERMVMTWVVIVIMIVFVGGSALQQIMMRMGGGKQVVATYDNNKKINQLTRQSARQDLQILAQLRAKEFLLSQPSPIPRQPSFKGMLLSQLLFTDTQTSPMIAQMLKSAASQGNYNIEQDDIDSFFEEIKGYSDIYWILLKQEARDAGIVITVEQAKAYLKSFIPQLSNNQVDAAAIVNGIMEQSNLTEAQIIGTFADLLSIMAYTDMVLMSEDVTNSQLRAAVSQNNEKIKADYVTFPADNFVDDVAEPTEAEIVKHFDKFKNFLTNDFTQDNPYGFSYMLPDRVQLEYIAIQMSDIKETIPTPTAQEMENHYQNNLSSYTKSEKVDPSDPESESITKQKTYAEVQQNIEYTLISRKTSNKADLIMNEAVVLTDQGLSSDEMKTVTSQQMKEKSASFAEAASRLESKFGVKVYTGKTGYLSLEDLVNDSNLGRLSIDTGSQQPLQLAKAVFAINELQVSKLSKFEGQAPVMWENIGPMKDQFGRIDIIVRVVDAKKSQVPTDVNVEYNTQSVDLGKEDQEESKYSVKEFVTEDVKLLKALGKAKQAASEFLKAAKDADWDKAVSDYNEALTKIAESDSDEETKTVAGKIELENISDMNIVSDSQIESMKKFVAENPSMSMYVKGNMARMLFIQKLHKLYIEGGQKDADMNTVVEFKPSLSCYAVKNVETTAATKQDYAKLKSQNAMMYDFVSAEALAVVHYNPANLEKRMNFKFVQEQEDTEGSDDAEE